MNPPPSTLRFPRLPVPLYVAILEARPSSSKIAEVKEAVRASVEFWRARADVDLLWPDELVEELDIPALSATSTDRAPLDELFSPGGSALPLYFTGREIVDRNSKYYLTNNYTSDSVGGYVGKTWFAQPWHGLHGYGCVIPRPLLQGRWNAVAHEIGHAFGLPHLAPEDEEAESEICMAPFNDDLSEYTQNNHDANLMSYAGGNEPADLENIWLSESQVRRSRLTIVSRTCPYERRFLGGLYIPPDVASYGPLMADLPAHSSFRMWP